VTTVTTESTTPASFQNELALIIDTAEEALIKAQRLLREAGFPPSDARRQHLREVQRGLADFDPFLF
jgi:hypothetical protein